MANNQTPQSAATEGAPSEGNGVPEQERSLSPSMQRAEEMVDRWGERVGYYATVAGHQLLRLAARAREEVEDIWAEAQSIRRGETVSEPQSKEHAPQDRRAEH